MCRTSRRDKFPIRNDISPEERYCRGCHQVKHVSAFHSRSKRNETVIRSRCQECELESSRRYREANREAVNARKRLIKHPKEDTRRWHINGWAKRLGMSREALHAIIDAHGPTCDICGRIPSGGPRRTQNLSIDHCHATGAYRGLLCWDCNLVLGKMNDDPAWLRAAADYLERQR